ncbi:MAG: MlaD family protein, partial [Polyangiaceae bacterium]
ELWEAKTTYRAAFQDVAGLKPGAPVRMGGLDVGSVTGVGHDGNASDTRIFVTMSIVRREATRIRTDSVASVVGKGLLGDKMVELTVGTADASPLPLGALMRSEEPSDVFGAANKVAAATEQAVEHIQPLTRALGDPTFAADIKGTMADVHSLLDAIVLGDGTVHRLLFDRKQADEIDALIVHMSETSAHLDAALADVQDVTAHVRQGPGLAHALVYDGEVSKNTAGTLAELHDDLRAIREGNGLAHEVLFGDSSSSQHVMSNISAMSDDLRVIVSSIKQGKGTLGALLVDPTVYEDIKSAVGNVGRNEVLRALVRYSIKADEKPPLPEAH